MKTLGVIAAIAASFFCSSCAKKEPAFPLAGLDIQNGSAICGFYSGNIQDGSLNVGVTTNEMSYTENGHELSIVWDSRFGKTEDEYVFQITLDGVVTSKEVRFSGAPIKLLHDPISVSLMNINR